MLAFTARRQQEIVRCGCTTAITGIKPNKRKRKVIGSKILHERRIVIPGAVHEIDRRKSEIIGEKPKS